MNDGKPSKERLFLGPLVWLTLLGGIAHGQDVRLQEQFGHSEGPQPTTGSASQDGRLIVTSGYDGTVRLWDLQSSSLLRVLYSNAQKLEASGRNFALAALSPDGKRYVIVSNSRILAGETETDRPPREIGREISPGFRSPRLNPLSFNGCQSSATLMSGKTVTLIHPERNEVTPVFRLGDSGTILRVWQSPDCSRILVVTRAVGRQSRLQLLQLAGGETEILTTLPQAVSDVEFTPGGESLLWIAAASGRRTWANATEIGRVSTRAPFPVDILPSDRAPRSSPCEISSRAAQLMTNPHLLTCVGGEAVVEVSGIPILDSALVRRCGAGNPATCLPPSTQRPALIDLSPGGDWLTLAYRMPGSDELTQTLIPLTKRDRMRQISSPLLDGLYRFSRNPDAGFLYRASAWYAEQDPKTGTESAMASRPWRPLEIGGVGNSEILTAGLSNANPQIGMATRSDGRQVWTRSFEELYAGYLAKPYLPSAFSYDIDPARSRVAIGLATGLVRVLDWKTGAPVSSLMGIHSQEARISPSGGYAFSVEMDGRAKILDIRSGHRTDLFSVDPQDPGGQEIQLAEFVSTGDLLLISGDRISLIDPSSGKVRRETQCAGAFSKARELRISPDGHYVLAERDQPGSYEFSVIGAADCAPASEIHGIGVQEVLPQPDYLVGKEFMEDGRERVVSCPYVAGKCSELIPPALGSALGEVEAGGESLVQVLPAEVVIHKLDPSGSRIVGKRSIAASVPFLHRLSPTGRYLLWSDADATSRRDQAPAVHLLDLNTGLNAGTTPSPGEIDLQRPFTWMRGDAQFAVLGIDGTLVAYAAEGAREIWRLPSVGVSVPIAHYFLNAQELLVGSDSTLYLVDADHGTILRRSEFGTISSLGVNVSRSLALIGKRDGVAVLWDPKNWRQVASFAAHSGSVTFAGFLPGKAIAVTGGIDGSVKFWRVPSGELLCTLLVGSDGNLVAVAPGGRFDPVNFERIPANWIPDDSLLTGLPIEIYTRTHYTPGLLARILDGEVLPSLPNVSLTNRLLPNVDLEIVGQEVRPDTATFKVRVRVRPTVSGGKSSGARDLRLYRNGQLVRSSDGDLELKQGVFTSTYEVPFVGQFDSIQQSI